MVDAEIMLGTLMRDGLQITNDAAQADVVIVNTCSFIDAAQEESVDTILESAALRDARHRGQALVVSGCLPQRFRDDLPKLMPEVDAFIGIDQVAQISEIVRRALEHRAAKLGKPESKVQSPKPKVQSRLAALDAGKPEKGEVIRGTEKFGQTKTVLAPPPSTLDPRTSAPLVEVHLRPTYIPDHAAPRFRLTPRHFAYVKIAEGCNHPCSFCIIPRMRGSHRSRPQRDLVQEARQLLADGVKELNLISQDSTYYGLDLRPKRDGSIAAPDRFRAAAKSLPADATTLGSLLRELNSLPGEFWVRILYTHPAHWTDELIQTLAACPKVARYVDIPLQHIHEDMLARMRRETSQSYIVDLLRRLRAGVPGLALRTTFIVGFPGETEAHFQTLLDFIRETKFERLGVFTYSRENGTVAGRMAGQVPDKVKQRRRELAMAAQHEVAQAVAASFVGRTIKVLVEGQASARDLKAANVSSWEHGLIRTADTRNSKLGTRNYFVARGEADAPDIDGRVYVRGRLPVGEFARVKVIGHTDYDLIAEPV
ncbi:MAG: 30S ribosomal protein S12 methylthiotransferase RimO [Verrucomicrobia bacterium]|nr:30S ribosomal protein S12 methylthiotransferase RimO [Verrucomicrobiota bacterium]